MACVDKEQTVKRIAAIVVVLSFVVTAGCKTEAQQAKPAATVGAAAKPAEPKLTEPKFVALAPMPAAPTAEYGKFEIEKTKDTMTDAEYTWALNQGEAEEPGLMGGTNKTILAFRCNANGFAALYMVPNRALVQRRQLAVRC